MVSFILFGTGVCLCALFLALGPLELASFNRWSSLLSLNHTTLSITRKLRLLTRSMSQFKIDQKHSSSYLATIDSEPENMLLLIYLINNSSKKPLHRLNQ